MDKNRLRDAARNNIVTIMFIVLCAVCMAFSGYAPNYVLYELFGRLSRNMFIVLSLIIPIVAGMGINFAITIGAMAAQIACLLVLEWGVPGIGGLALAALLTVPLGGVFGFLIGKLLNKMKGQEMIGSMILGYFANGLYQLLFLFIFDNIIPIHNPNLTIKGSKGIANTMDLSREGGFAYSLEKLWQLPASQAAIAFAVVAALVLIVGYVTSHRKNAKKLGVQLAVIAAAAAVMQLPAMKNLFSMVNVPMATFGVVALLCLFNVVIMRTRLGQQFRAVGQNGVVANAAGIDVDRVRIIAIVFSTILAGWGQLIFVQNMGSFQTYGAHEQVGLYAGAAILVGGASVIRATNTQALVGCVLFHLMFILAPAAGKNLFGDAAIGEYFRVFICYGVIALSLVMHAWSENNRRKQAASGEDFFVERKIIELKIRFDAVWRKKMKQTFVLLLTLMLILTASVAVAQLGEPVQDFTVVNKDGTLTALSGLLQTKKAVLLHFFAGWLDEDYSDLPAVQAAYAQYGEDIGFIVVSVEEQETVQSLAAARAQNELTDLPLSLGGLSAFGQFGSAYIPLTVVVNADGTSGFEFDGVLGAEALERVLAVFVRTDGPLAMETVPQEAE